MGYEQPSLLLQSENPAHHVRMADLPVLKRSQDYRFFQQLLLLDEEAIYRMTLHRFASRLSRSAPFSFEFESALSHPYSSGESVPLHWLDGWSYRTYFYANAYTQICPECLDEQGAYSYLYWKCRYVMLCPRHATFLINSCPICHSSTPALRPSQTICPSCQRGDYRIVSERLRTPLRKDSFLFSATMLTLRALGVESAFSHPVDTSTELANQPLTPLDYFTLLRVLSTMVEQLSADYLHTFLPPEFYSECGSQSCERGGWRESLAIVHFLFTSWPTHFWGLLDALSLLALHYGNSFEGYCEWPLYERLLGSSFDFLRQVYKQYKQARANEAFTIFTQRIESRLRAYGNISLASLQRR